VWALIAIATVIDRDRDRRRSSVCCNQAVTNPVDRSQKSAGGGTDPMEIYTRSPLFECE
jgi:hypothetical protein